MPDTKPKINQDCYARIIKRLIQDDASLTDLEEISGMHRVTLERLMRTLKKHGLVHIGDWLPDKLGRDAYKVYRWGKGKDKSRFRQTDAEKTRRWRERKKLISLHPTSLLSV